MYWTAWIALALFVAGESGRRSDRHAPHRRLAWRASALGAALLGTHILIALAVQHEWSHASAVAHAAHRTREVFGIAWGGGVWLNYLFITLWVADLTTWPPSRVRPTLLPVPRALMRIFFVIMIANATVVFVPGWRRLWGILLVVTLLAAWRPGRWG